MKPFKGFKEFLNEMPYLYNKRMNLEKISNISKEALERYTKIGRVPTQNFDVYENKENGTLLGGILIDGEFYPLIFINCEERSLFVKSMQLKDKRKHIKLVRVNENFSDQKVSTDMYTFVAKHFDLISDRIQYKGAKDLWKTLAKQNRINVYVFDEETKDYIRSEGKIVKYNGKNLDDSEIWGSDLKHQARLLVAVNRELE